MPGTMSDEESRPIELGAWLRSNLRMLAEAIAIACVFFILAKVAIELTRGSGRIAAVWLPNAVVVAILLRRPAHYMWPMAAATAVANILANLTVGDTWPIALGLSLANSVEVLIAVIFVRRLCGTYPDPHALQSLMVMSFLAAVVAPVCSGLVATLVLGPLRWPDAATTWESWVIPDALGMLLALPAILILIDGLRQPPRLTWHASLQWIGTFIVGTTVGLLIFFQNSYPLLFLAAPAVLLQAFRQGAVGTAVATSVMAGIAIQATANDYGPIALMDPDPWYRIMILQLFLAVVFLMGLPISAMLEDKRKAMAELAASRQQLRLAHEKMEQALRGKAQFLANMSHEIRTPMNGVLGFADLLSRTELTQEQRRKVEVIKSSGSSMMKLLNDILDVSKIDAGSISIVRESVNLRELLDECIALNSAEAGKKGLSLSVKVAASVPISVEADQLRLQQIILNLTANAIKFTEKGRVSLEAFVEQENLLIAVRDTGIGVAPERLEAIFLPFEQGDSTTSRRFGGTGLGLSISHQLAQLMGGALTVESTPGRGSAFKLSLPLIADHAAAVEVTMAHPSPTVAPQEMRARRILLAEDHDVNRELVREMLGELGFDVEMAVDGNEAIDKTLQAKAAGAPYDLVLMDIQMPHCDGYEAARAIRAAGISDKDLPIVAITANAYPEDIQAAHDAGMQGHLAKPLSLSRLDRLLRMMIGSSVSRKADLRTNARLAAMWTENCIKASSAVREYLETREPSHQARAACSTLAHQIAGTAERFGASELGQLAARVERALEVEADEDDLRDLLKQFLAQFAMADRRVQQA